MKKLIIPVLILGTIGLIVLFGFLPGVVFSASDRSQADTPSFTAIEPVSLDAAGALNYMSVQDKLALLANGETVAISQDQMHSLESDVSKGVMHFVEKCAAAGILQPFEPTTFTLQPKLIYDLSDFSKHLTVWTVVMLNETDPHQSLLLDVDDETGQILCLSYDIAREFAVDKELVSHNKTIMETFTNLYFEQLELSQEATAIKASNPETDGETRYSYAEKTNGSTYATYTFESPTFGKFHIQFTVDGASNLMVAFFL